MYSNKNNKTKQQMTEQQIQKKITDNLESDGWVVVKLMKTSTNGIPDLICLFRKDWIE